MFAGTTGMIDNTNVLITRDRNLNLLPLGSPLEANTYQNAVDFYFSDTWRIRPSLTISGGLNYQIQFPPVDSLGRTAFMIDSATGQTLNSTDYLNNAREAALHPVGIDALGGNHDHRGRHPVEQRRNVG